MLFFRYRFMISTAMALCASASVAFAQENTGDETLHFNLDQTPSEVQTQPTPPIPVMPPAMQNGVVPVMPVAPAVAVEGEVAEAEAEAEEEVAEEEEPLHWSEMALSDLENELKRNGSDYSVQERNSMRRKILRMKRADDVGLRDKLLRKRAGSRPADDEEQDDKASSASETTIELVVDGKKIEVAVPTSEADAKEEKADKPMTLRERIRARRLGSRANEE